MNWSEYPILRLLVPLIIGILIYIHFPEWVPNWTIGLVSVIIVGFLAWPKKYLFPYKHRYFSGLIIYSTVLLFGISLAQFQYPYEHKQYFSTYRDSTSVMLGRIVELPELKPKSVKVIIEVEKMVLSENSVFTKGRAILYLEKDTNSMKLNYGDNIIFKNTLKEVQAPQNPDEFDYRKYLFNGGIRYQAYLKSNNWSILLESSKTGLQSWALWMRQYLLDELQNHNLKDAEYSVAAAMLLGVRNLLSPELQQAFSGAGAMHILCVSGLHVGIIFMILNSLFVFLERMKRGKYMKAIIIISSIWLYALITGLSPSVVRAATMFSFISIGQNIGRQVNIYNSLAASAFVLLALKPFLILDVGFQLSYAAVIAIVALQKPIQNLWTPNQFWLFKGWQLITVSLAAQIGTAPLALYYFHSFPNYFILTNLIVIPAAFAIFITGIGVLAFSWTGPFADYLGWILSKMVGALNWAITGIENLPFAVSSDIYISFFQLCTLISISVLGSTMLINEKPKLIFINLFLFILFLADPIFQSYHTPQFIVYQTGKWDYISCLDQGKEVAITDADILEYPHLIDYQTKEHKIRYHVKNTQRIDLYNDNDISSQNTHRFAPFLSFFDLRMAIITPKNVDLSYSGKIDLDYLIISDNPDLYFKNILSMYSCKQIIICPSNAPWNVQKWKQELALLEIPIWDVKESGAFIKDLE